MNHPSDPHDPYGNNGKTRADVTSLPDRTQRVPTQVPDPAEAGSVPIDTTTAGVLAEAGDDDVSVQPVGPVRAYEASSSAMSSSSTKARRRQRDRRAESRAVQVLVGLFVGVGGLALVAVNVLLDDPEPGPLPVATAPDETPQPVPPPPETVISTPFVEQIDLPALRQLKNEGLTIAAEGLPEVSSPERGARVGPLAARETCRFAYGVWEFSPNKRFRFLPTCAAMDGQVLYGAYAVDGAVIRMSPLRVSGAEIVSEFQVEKPSRMLTRVAVQDAGVNLEVRQRVTVIRAGLAGDGFFSTYADRNTLSVPGARAQRRAPREASPPPPAKKRDPLLELLKGTTK